VCNTQYNKVMIATLSDLGHLEDTLDCAALELARTCYGPQSAQTIDQTCQLGQVLAVEDRLEEAKETLGRVLVARTRFFGSDHYLTR